MPDKPIELSIEVPAETRREIERAAAERGMTVPEFLEEALRKYLVIPATSTKRLPPISNRGWARQFEEPIGLPDGRKLGRVLINPIMRRAKCLLYQPIADINHGGWHVCPLLAKADIAHP